MKSRLAVIVLIVAAAGCGSEERADAAQESYNERTRPVVEVLLDDENATFYRVQATIGGSANVNTVAVRQKPSGEWFIVHDKDDLAVTRIPLQEKP